MKTLLRRGTSPRNIGRSLVRSVLRDHGLIGRAVSRKLGLEDDGKKAKSKKTKSKKTSKSQSAKNAKKTNKSVPASQVSPASSPQPIDRAADELARKIARAFYDLGERVDEASDRLTRSARELESELSELSTRVGAPAKKPVAAVSQEERKEGGPPGIGFGIGSLSTWALRVLPWVAPLVTGLSTIGVGIWALHKQRELWDDYREREYEEYKKTHGTRATDEMKRSIDELDDPLHVFKAPFNRMRDVYHWLRGDSDDKSQERSLYSLDVDGELTFKAREIEFKGAVTGASGGSWFDFLRGFGSSVRKQRAVGEGSPASSESVGPGSRPDATAPQGSRTPRSEGSQSLGEGATSTNGKQVPPEVLKRAEDMLRAGGSTAEIQQFMTQQGYPMRGNWCGEFAAAVVHSAGGTPPKNPAIASNWLKYGERADKPIAGDVMVRKTDRHTGAPLVPGQVGGHVGFFTGRYDKAGRPIIAGGNGGIHPVDPRDYEFRHVPEPPPEDVAKSKPEGVGKPAPVGTEPPLDSSDKPDSIASEKLPAAPPLPRPRPVEQLVPVEAPPAPETKLVPDARDRFAGWGDDDEQTRREVHVIVRDRTTRSYVGAGDSGPPDDRADDGYDEGPTMRAYVGGDTLSGVA